MEQNGSWFKSIMYGIIFWILFISIYFFIHLIAIEIDLFDYFSRKDLAYLGTTLSQMFLLSLIYGFFIFLPMLFSSRSILRSERERLPFKAPIKIMLKLLIIAALLIIASIPLSFFGGGHGIPPFLFAIFIIPIFYIIISIFVWILSWLVYFSSSQNKPMIILTVLIVFLSIVSIIILSLNSFCLRIDGDCSGNVDVKKNNIAVCDKSLRVADCHFEYGIQTGNLKICDDIASHAKQACYLHYAIRNNNPEVCKKVSIIDGLNWRETCCETVYGDKKENEYFAYGTELTMEQKSICGLDLEGTNRCEDVKNKEKCLLYLAKDDKSICELIKPPQIRNSCYNN